jgi:hypothetical protein
VPQPLRVGDASGRGNYDAQGTALGSVLEEGTMNAQASREMGEISARLECQHELRTPPGIKKVADVSSKVGATGGPWSIIKHLGSVSAPVPWLLF